MVRVRMVLMESSAIFLMVVDIMFSSRVIRLWEPQYTTAIYPMSIEDSAIYSLSVLTTQSREVCEGNCAIGVVQTCRFQHQAFDGAMEMQEQLLSDRTFVIEGFEMLTSVVVPGNRIGQVNKSNAVFANNFEIGCATVGE